MNGSRRCRVGLVLPLALLCLALSSTPASADIVYLYDPLGRLVRVIDETGPAATYIYDPVGNILQITRQTGISQDQTSIATVDPPSGAQGTQVTLTFTGTNLAGASLPTLPPGFTFVSSALSVSGNQDVLTVTLALDPELALGPHSLTLVSSLGGATPLPFTLNVVPPPPRVDRVIPPIVTMGNLVQVEGNGFDAANPSQNQVTISSVPLPVVSVSSKTKLIAQILPGVSTGPVQVTTPQGTGVSPAPLTVVPGTHPQQNVVATTLRSPFRAPTRIAVSPDGSRAYVLNGLGIDAFGTNRGGNNVTVVDAARHEVLGLVPVGARPTALALTPDGTRALVTNSSCPCGLTVIDTLTLGVVGTVSLPTSAQDVVPSPDGTRAYMAVDTPAVVVVDLQTLTQTAQIPLSVPAEYVAISPDGNTLYAIGRTVAVIDASTGQILRSIAMNAGVMSYALDPAAQRLYVGLPLFSANNVRVLDLVAGTVSATLSVAGHPTVALSPDRTRLYLIGGDTQLRVLGTATLGTVGTVTVGAGHSFIGSGRPFPNQSLLVSPDGGTVWVANADDHTVSVVDARALAVAATVPVGSTPHGLGLVQGDAALYVLNNSDNTVSVLQTATNELLVTALGRFGLAQPLGLAAIPDGSAGYVVNHFVSTTTAFAQAAGSGLATLRLGDSHAGLHVAPSLTRNELYVGNASPPGIAVLDLATRAQKSLLALPQSPRALALSLDERRLYVATEPGTRMTTFDTATGAIVGDVSLHATLTTDQIALNPEGTRLYVLHFSTGGAGATGLVRVLDTATQSQVATIPVANAAFRLTVDRIGRLLYVSSHSALTIVDSATNQVVATIPIGLSCCMRNVVFTLDGSKAYVGIGFPGNVVVINTATSTVRTTVTPAGSPRGLAMSPDGARVFVTTEGVPPGGVTVIDTGTDQVVATLTVGNTSAQVSGGLMPINVAFSPDGARVWVVNFRDDSLSVIE